MMSEPATARFNHIAMSVPADLLRAPSSGELLDFYREVFGWTAMPSMSKDGELLVLRVHSNEQFVYLAADDSPMQCPAGDHIGLSVETPAELYEVYERAKKYRARDDRVEILDAKVDDFKVLALHSFYVRYRLPLMIEIQCFDWAKGVGPDSLPPES
jgi:hypothetical protein